MRAPRIRACLGISLLALMFSCEVHGGQLAAGAAKIDITPQPGVSLDGAISKNGPVESIHDHLHARALVLCDGTSTIALVVVDQCMTVRDVFDRAKRSVKAATKIPIECQLMAATHTHAAPRTAHIATEPIDNEYHEWLSEQIAKAVVRAHANMAPATIAYTSFDRGDLLACRRHLAEPGSVGANPFGEVGEQIKSVAGRSNKIIRPAGPVDPQFSVISIQHTDGTPLCVLGNFSVHYCGGYRKGVVSADYFGHFSEAIEKTIATTSKHPPVIGIMSNGTSGNTGAFQHKDGKRFKPFEAMAHYGRMLADESLQAIDPVTYQNDIQIKSLQSELEFAVRKPSKERLQWADKMLATDKAKHPHRWTTVYANEAKHLAKFPDRRSFLFQAFRIGDIAIVSAPCEVFAETGLAIKEASPIKHAFTMELANGYGGYLPTTQQHELGGYETWPARSSFLEVGAEATIRAEMIHLLEQL